VGFLHYRYSFSNENVLTATYSTIHFLTHLLLSSIHPCYSETNCMTSHLFVYIPPGSGLGAKSSRLPTLWQRPDKEDASDVHHCTSDGHKHGITVTVRPGPECPLASFLHYTFFLTSSFRFCGFSGYLCVLHSSPISSSVGSSIFLVCQSLGNPHAG
jgi:hypothetical protein